MTLCHKLALFFEAYISTEAAADFGLPALTVPRRTPQDGDTEGPALRLEIDVKRNFTGTSSSEITVEFHLYCPQDTITKTDAEAQMDALRLYIHHADFDAFRIAQTGETGEGWQLASGLRDEPVSIDLMEDRLERRFSVAVGFYIANDPGT